VTNATHARRGRILPKISIQFFPKAPARTPPSSFPSSRCTPAAATQTLRGLFQKDTIRVRRARRKVFRAPLYRVGTGCRQRRHGVPTLSALGADEQSEEANNKCRVRSDADARQI